MNNGKKGGNYVWNGARWGSKVLQTPQLVGSSGYAIINADSLNIRYGPSVKQKIVKTLTRNTRVEILDRTGNWWKIKYESIEGYVNSAYLR
jgi:uncharacterized protein YgiM (DUF1202 family)